MGRKNYRYSILTDIYLVVKPKTQMRTKLFFIASAIACLCSCVQTDDYEHSWNYDNIEIQFNLGKNSVTRSGIVTGTTMTQDFRVFGYVNTSQDNIDVIATGARYIMKDARFLSDGTPADSKKYYWPAYSDFTANFTAYSPANYLANETDYWENDVLTIPVDASAMDDNCVDLLIANTSNVSPEVTTSTVTDNKTIRTSKVDLQFRHALSYIQFQAKHEDNDAITYAKITSISFTNPLMTKNTLTLNTGNSYSATWGTANTPDDNNEFAGNVTLSDEYQKLSEMLIVPQNVPTTVTIVYDITIHNETGDAITYRNRSLSRTINTGEDANTDGKFTAYESGKKYVYRVNLTVNELEFNVTISDWTTNDWWQIWDHDTGTTVDYSF